MFKNLSMDKIDFKRYREKFFKKVKYEHDEVMLLNDEAFESAGGTEISPPTLYLIITTLRIHWSLKFTLF